MPPFVIVILINPSHGLCKQVISVRRKTLPSPLFVHANGGHRFPGCGQDGEPSGDEGGVKFVTKQIWPLESGHYLNPHLISNVKYTLSPFLTFLNKWRQGRDKMSILDLAFIFMNLSFFFFLNSLYPSGEECSTDRTTKT